MIQLFFILSSVFLQPIISRRLFVTNSLIYPLYKSVLNNENDDSTEDDLIALIDSQL